MAVTLMDGASVLDGAVSPTTLDALLVRLVISARCIALAAELIIQGCRLAS
jgi:hypothetical protein